VRFYINIEEKQKTKEEGYQKVKEEEKEAKVARDWGGIKKEEKKSEKTTKDEKMLRLNEERKK